jgi:hypothetical protein
MKSASEFAEIEENPIIWQSRLRIAEDLELQADQLIALRIRGASNGWQRQ